MAFRKKGDKHARKAWSRRGEGEAVLVRRGFLRWAAAMTPEVLMFINDKRLVGSVDKVSFSLVMGYWGDRKIVIFKCQQSVFFRKL